MYMTCTPISTTPLTAVNTYCLELGPALEFKQVMCVCLIVCVCDCVSKCVCVDCVSKCVCEYMYMYVCDRVSKFVSVYDVYVCVCMSVCECMRRIWIPEESSAIALLR